MNDFLERLDKNKTINEHLKSVLRISHFIKLIESKTLLTKELEPIIASRYQHWVNFLSEVHIDIGIEDAVKWFNFNCMPTVKSSDYATIILDHDLNHTIHLKSKLFNIGCKNFSIAEKTYYGKKAVKAKTIEITFEGGLKNVDWSV